MATVDITFVIFVSINFSFLFPKSDVSILKIQEIWTDFAKEKTERCSNIFSTFFEEQGTICYCTCLLFYKIETTRFQSHRTTSCS